jgi:peptide/nickel transport system substrate-binding protein
MINVVWGENGTALGKRGRRTGVSKGLRALAALVLVLGAGVFSGCGSSASGGGGSSTLRIGLPAAEQFDPARAVSAGEGGNILYSLVYAPLIHMSPSGEFEPALAASWEYVEAGGAEPNSVFELTLRKGAKFSDGTPVDADAVVKWLNYFVESPGLFNQSFGEDPKFEAVDAQTVRIEMTSPNPSIPFVLSDAGLNAGFVVAPKAIDNPKSLGTQPVGAGPYVLDASKSVGENKYVFKKNPDYFAANDIAYEGAEVRVIGEGSSRLQSQQSGQLDLAQGEAGTVDAAEGAGLEILSEQTFVAFMELDLVHNPPAPLKDVRVRRAMNLAINRDAITEALYGKLGSPTSSFLPGDIDTSKLQDYWEYNPEKAKQELAAAGYPNGFTIKALSQGAYAGPEGEPIMRAVAKDLEEVGIKLDITSTPTAAGYSEAVETFEYPLLELASAVWPTVPNYNLFLAPKSPVNYVGSDAEINRLYEEGAKSKTPEVDFGKMWERFTSQGYTVPTVAVKLTFYVSSDVSGAAMTPKRPLVLPTELSPKLRVAEPPAGRDRPAAGKHSRTRCR